MDCLFCKIGKKEISSQIIYEDANYLAFLDMDQSVEGHTLIIPKQHVEDYTLLDEITLKEMFELANKIGLMLMEKLNKKGLTLLFNYGESQTIKHTHLHILPDFIDDFEKRVKNTLSIEEIYTKLKGE